MLAALAPAGARADVIVRDGFKQKFEASVKGVTPSTAKADGPYTFVLNWETESVSAPVAPPVTDVEIKLPAGIELRKQFQTGSTVCSQARLVANLSCNGAKIGQGEVKLDFQPFTSQTVPADVSVYLGPATPGSVGSLLIKAVPRTGCGKECAFADANPIVANTRPVIAAPIYRDSSSGFGLRMEMPIDIDAPVVVSIRSFSITMAGTTSPRLKSSKGRKVFWASQPACKKAVKFQATFSYIGVSAVTVGSTVPIKFKCPRVAGKKKKKQ